MIEYGLKEAVADAENIACLASALGKTLDAGRFVTVEDVRTLTQTARTNAGRLKTVAGESVT